MDPQPLAGRTVAVPETRELEVFAAMLERRGASVVRCPLVAIHDAPDPAPVLAFARSFAGGSCDDLILSTGEGLRRILACIERHEPALKARFLVALASVRKITRGPKPARALRELGLKPDLPAQPPEFLERAGATVLSVAPYVYADGADDAAVRGLLARLSAGEVDAIAFTSTPQVERLFAVAPAAMVSAALAHTLVAAVGPVVAEALGRHGIKARLMPEESFFLKPLTTALEEALRAHV